MLQKILLFVFLMQFFSVATALKPGESTVVSQIPKPANNVSGTVNPVTLQDVAKELKGASEISPKDLDSEESKDPSSNVVLHPIDKIRHLNTPIAIDTRRSESNKNEETPTLAEALALHRCVPTAINIGPCHSCVCSDHGVYFCRPEDCRFADHEPSSSGQPECEKNMLYNEGSLWCNCNAHSLWRSANCRENFRYMRNRKSGRTHPDLPTNYTCEKGSYYAVDCNICECKTGVLSIASCTNRSCVPGHRTDECKLGQVLRQPNEMCACSAIGYYVDKLCATFNNNDTIQKLSKKQLAALTYEDQSVVIETAGFKDRCRPNTIIHRDCNKCRCTESNELVCTNKLCLDFPTGNHLRSNLERYKKTAKGTSSYSKLPELKSDRQPCVPGKQYKYKCNMCMCSKKGIPSCTTMICLDQFESPTVEQTPKKSKSDKKQKLRQNYLQQKVSKKTGQGNRTLGGSLLRGILPHIKDGEPCLPGKVYRQDCNICRCSDTQTLICSKMLCFQSDVTPKKGQIKQKKALWKRTGEEKSNSKDEKTSDKHKDVRSGKIQTTKSGRVISKKSLRSASKGKSRAVKPSFREGHGRSKVKDYLLLPTTKCEPGMIYKKPGGCQRCFCTERKIAQCTNRPCTEMTGKVRVPKDVYPRVAAKEFNTLPELPHQAAKCNRGVVYRIDCNICLCLHNGNLLCNTLLCLALNEVNRITANKLSSKPCQEEDFTDIDPLVDCVQCRCSKKGKSKCEPVDGCTPYRMRRSLHSELNPKIKPKAVLTEDESHCTPGMVYKQNCNNCYCQEDGSLRCTRKGCLNYELVEKLKEQRQKLLSEQKVPPRPTISPVL